MSADRENTVYAINLRLALLGLEPVGEGSAEDQRAVGPLLARHRELARRLNDELSGVDQRIEDFLRSYLAPTGIEPSLPRRTLVLDQPGMARELSLPVESDEFHSDLVSSYRLQNGVLHNPRNDRRTTAGVFHIAEGGLPIPDDKRAVPLETFGRMVELAFQPPRESMVLPFASTSEHPAACFASLHLQPTVAPAVPGFLGTKVMETRFIVPGGLVSNLDFVEGIFGNAGDPHLPENDAALDPERWTGTTGLVVLAPHLTKVTKKELGLPHISEATERQQRDQMCWESPDELYNGGSAFKVVARDERGVIVTIIADNYFGYCKKEVKTQISYSANLFGLAEEEHSGGTVAFPRWNLGQEWTDTFSGESPTVADVVARDPQAWVMTAPGCAVHADHPDVVLVPGGATYSMRTQTVTWIDAHGAQCSTPILAGTTFVTPVGYRVHAKARDADPTQWHMVGTSPDSTQCHKPATVSGGGKSEISKSLLDAFVFANAYVADADADLEMVQDLLDRDYSDRFRDPERHDDRPVLSEERSLGSVIKLLTPSDDYTDEYNAWLETIPAHVTELVYIVKRYYKPEWGTDWMSHFTVGIMNGRKGNALRLDREKVMVNMLRVGFDDEGAWRLFSLRPDFSPAGKLQTEDDITASIVVGDGETSAKYVTNCERLLFQRPDDAIHRGYDKQTEMDMAGDDTFTSNFEPITREMAREMVTDAPGMSLFTEPMRQRIVDFASQDDDERPGFIVVSSEPRLVDGKRTKNPRYLQLRPDLADPESSAQSLIAAHLWRGVPLSKKVRMPVDAVIAGRRNNAADKGVPPLCAYNPLHYMELPELLMEFISSMTGKSPSTTGAGSEGAMTKGPFNALPSVFDLNAALLSYALTETDGWLSSAGVIGPKVRVDHDISLLIPELFSRMSTAERDARTLIDGGFLEKIADIEHDGRTIEASRLGYRINRRFVSRYFARLFLHPDVVFTTEMLKPELQDLDAFAESVGVIVTTHQRVAQAYLDDGTISMAVPPLRALLEIMANGHSSEGWTLDSAELRSQFTRESILASDWYAERLANKQRYDVERMQRAAAYLGAFVDDPVNVEEVARLGLRERLEHVRSRAERVTGDDYRASLVGSLGRDAAL